MVGDVEGLAVDEPLPLPEDAVGVVALLPLPPSPPTSADRPESLVKLVVMVAFVHSEGAFWEPLTKLTAEHYNHPH